jgi:hypothetical protein
MGSCPENSFFAADSVSYDDLRSAVGLRKGTPPQDGNAERLEVARRHFAQTHSRPVVRRTQLAVDRNARQHTAGAGGRGVA